MSVAEIVRASTAPRAPLAPPEMPGSRFIAETLKGYGVTHVFFMESVLRQTLIEMEVAGIHRVLAHSEAAAVYMADGYARISRRPAVCMAQSVGAANMAAALQDPYLGLSPVLALTGKKVAAMQHRNAYQEIRHDPLYEAVTKFNATVETPEQLPRLLRQALREATSGAPGPVHLDIAGGFGGETIEAARAPFRVVVEEAFARVPAFRPEPEPGPVHEAAALLKRAKRPILVAGGGARLSDAGPEILRLAERLALPVATSLNAKGIIPENHPLCVGVIGTYSRRCANQAVSEADLVLFVGSHTGEQVTTIWTIPALDVPMIQIDIDPRELGRSYAGVVPILADAKAALARLVEVAEPRDQPRAWTQRCEDLVRVWHADYAEASASRAAPIAPERLCREIQEALPQDGILVADTGNSGIWTGALVEIRRPGQDFLRAAGSLGWGFPASLGAKCAAPGRPVLCFTGDAGFWYHLSELETARRHGIDTVTIINNNSGLGQCVPGIDRHYGDRPGNRGDLHSFSRTNFAAIAGTIGCLGIRVEDPDEIAPAIETALRSGGPSVIDVVTDIQARAPAPWAPQPKA